MQHYVIQFDTDKASRMIIVPYWPTQIWFPALMEIVTDNPIVINRKKNNTNITSSRPTASAGLKAYSDCMSSVRENFESRGLSETSTNIPMSSWKHSTKKQYETFIKKCFVYCSKSKLNQFESSLENVIEFLRSLFEKGLGYSSINTVRSALLALGLKSDSIFVGQDALIIRC